MDKRIKYDLKMIEKDERCLALDSLQKFFKKDQKDFFKLINTLELQLKSKELLKNDKRLSFYNKDHKLLEFKSVKGCSRLFAFLYQTDIIVCLSGYWKTTGKKVKQNSAFKKAYELRKNFLEEIENL